MATRYQKRPEKRHDAVDHEVWRSTPEVGEALEYLVRRGAQEMLRRALEAGRLAGLLGRSRLKPGMRTPVEREAVRVV